MEEIQLKYIEIYCVDCYHFYGSRRIRDTDNVRLIMDLQKLIMERVTVQRVTVSATDHSTTGDHLSSLNEERCHIAGPSATGNLLRSIQGYISNICRLARRV